MEISHPNVGMSVEEAELAQHQISSHSHFLITLSKQHYPPGFPKKVVAEVMATYMLVFVTCGSAALSGSDENKVSKLAASVAGGLIVTVMIYAVGHISGAHMNPAVTLAFAALRHLPWTQIKRWDRDIVKSMHSLMILMCTVELPTILYTPHPWVPFYAVAQLTGALTASFSLRVILHPIENLGTTTPSGTDTQALIMEIVVTFSMMFIATAVSTDTKAIGELGGVAVGSAVCITSILAGPVSGGSMNPARTIGPAVASSCYKGLWVYIVGPIIGTLLGALSYNFIRATHKPVEAVSTSPSFSLKLHRLTSNNLQLPLKNTFNDM